MRFVLVTACCVSLVFQLLAQSNLSFLSRKIYTEDLSDVWGYAAGGKEYALVGARSGVSIVDITDPAIPAELFFVSTAVSDWHDIATWNGYAYVTNETGGGMTVINLNFLPDSIQSSTTNGGVGLTTAHTVFTDENGIAYVAGGNISAGRGVLMFDVDADPDNPPYLGRYDFHYVHDLFVRGDTMWTAEVNDGIFAVVDISDKNNPSIMADRQTPNNFTHNTWLSDNGTTLLTTDEVNNATITSYNVTDLGNIRELDRFQFNPGSNSLPHNVHYLHDFAVASYYRDGVVIVDASDPENLIAVGNYDTSPLSGGGYNGCWSVYPYLPSGNIIASDIERGLFVLAPAYRKACYLEGVVTDIITGQPVNNASVTILPSNPVDYTGLVSFMGEYKTGIGDSGSYSVQFAKSGYVTHIENNVSLDNGIVTTLNVQLIPVINVTLAGKVFDAADSAGIAGCQVLLANSGNTFFATTDSSGNFTINNFATGLYQAYAGKWDYITQLNNTAVYSDTSISIGLQKGYYDDFMFDFGWDQTSAATSGAWEMGIPAGTTFNGQTVNPDADVTGDYGDGCYVTGNGGGQAANDDVDDGTVTLTSPLLDLSDYFDPYLKYQAWFFNGGGSGGSPNDTLFVRISDGTEIITVQTVAGTIHNSWNGFEVRVRDFMHPTDSMKIIFEASDINPAHLVEAGVDLFSVFDSLYPPVAGFTSDKSEGCPGDTFRMTDNTLYQPYSWLWIFPGGVPSISAEQNPAVVYEQPGTYNVTLIATNIGGTDTFTRSSLIVIHQPPVIQAQITKASTASGNDGSIEISISGNSPFAIQWNTGSTDTLLQNLAAGDYAVTATDSFGCATADTFTVLIVPLQPPVAAFTSDKTQGCPGDTFRITDLSSNQPEFWQWQFPGGMPSSSVAQNPSVIYNNPGVYDISLIASNDAGSDTLTRQAIIVIHEPPVIQADITKTSASSSADGSIEISITGNPPFTIQWSNGSADSVLQNLTAGGYPVTVTDSFGCIASDTLTVETEPLQPPVAGFTPDKTEGCTGDTFTITDLSANQPETWAWQFPGGNPESSSDQNPSVVYNASGDYSITLITANAAGNDTLNRQAIITVHSPPAITASITDATSAASADGSIEIILNGNPSNEITWSDGSSDPLLENLGAGDYTVTVTDTFGCANSDTLTVGIVTGINDLNLTVRYLPNPFSNRLLIETNTRSGISFYNSIGAELQDVNLEAGEIFFWGENIQPGIYFMLISSGKKAGSPVKLIKIK